MALTSKRLAIILGAGSSYDCGRESDVEIHWRPPLVTELFGNRPTFNTILQQYPGAENLAYEIRGAVARGTEGFEEILRRFAYSTNRNVKLDYRHVPLYLQELIGDVSANYIRSGGTAFSTLVRALDTSHYERVLYMTVNYDLLLDRALERHYRIGFKSIDDYTAHRDRWALAKLHGSVNWGWQLQNGKLSDIYTPTRRVDEVTDDELNLDTRVEVLDGYKQGHRVRAQQFFYPALAPPIGDKDRFVCVPDHIEYTTEFLRQCTDFLIIGFSGLDSHVLGLLAVVPSVQNVEIVNGTSDEGRNTLDRISSASPAFAFATDRASKFHGGLASYIGDGGFGKFLEVAARGLAT